MIMSKVVCKRPIYNMLKGGSYEISYHSIFETNDYATITLPKPFGIHNFKLVRFRIKKGDLAHVIDGYIGDNEFYLYDFFYSDAELRKLKLKKLDEKT